MPGQRRRRDAELLAALHEAALAELDEMGLGRLTMEGIARRAGTPKTTLYRRWTAPEQVLLDAVAAAYPVEEPSPTADDLRGDLIAALELLVRWSRHPTARAVQAIMLERHRHPDLVASLQGTFDRLGQVDPALVTPVVEDIGEALVLKRALDTGEEPSAERLAEIVGRAILPAVGIRPV